MMRSAKRKAMTPPKEMPPFHRTAARGTLPTEQTKERTATRGPINGPPEPRQQRMPGEEEAGPPGLRHPGGEAAGDEQAAGDVGPQRVPVHPEVVAGGGDAFGAGELAPEGSGVEAHVHGGMAFHAAGDVLGGLLAGGFNDRGAERGAEEEDHDGDHDGAAGELGEGELPAEQDGEEDGELHDEVGGGELESHGSDEVRALTKEGAGESGGRVGAGGACCSEARRDEDSAGRRIGEELADLFLGDYGLDDGGEEKAEAERPEQLPGHDAGHAKGFEDCVDHVGSLWEGLTPIFTDDADWLIADAEAEEGYYGVGGATVGGGKGVGGAVLGVLGTGGGVQVGGYAVVAVVAEGVGLDVADVGFDRGVEELAGAGPATSTRVKKALRCRVRRDSKR